MKGRAVLLVVALVAVLAGCAEPRLNDPYAGPAGRACQAVGFAAVEAALGVRFETASSAQADETSSCALGMTHQSFPDLVATLTKTDIDSTAYRAILVPSGFAPVADLGRSAYETSYAAGSFAGSDGTPSGPSLQVGWLSASPQMMTLRFTWPTGAGDADVAALRPQLLVLAQRIESALVGA